jgi:CheY-like chemotaxis protein
MSKVALVVDDSMLIRYSVCRFLEERGFVVESAVDGSEALEKLSHVTPDLVVTDMKMPKMSGGELITALRARPETEHVPIVLITSNLNGCGDAEKRADFAIYKNIDIETQLEKALSMLPGVPTSRANSPSSKS